MSYLGDFALGKTFDTKFTSRAFATGTPTQLAGSPVISAYADNSTTQLTAGITLSVDFDSVTGLNNIRVVATSGNGYAAGSNYQLVITTGTVGGVSVVGEVVAEFSLEARSALRPATADRTLVVDAAGLADATTVKLGPSGSGSTQTARDVGASVLLSNGTGTGQLKLASGYVAMTWADIAAPTTAVNLSGTTIATTQKVDVETIKTNPVVNGGTLTFPSGATLASTTNITAGTITTTTNLTNAASNGDFTAVMKTSIGTAVAASAVASVTGNVGGNVVGSVGSVTGLSVALILTTAITEAYRANGAAPTIAQALSEILAHLGEAAISGTTKTINKFDHSTPAETFTLDDATVPTSITRAT